MGGCTSSKPPSPIPGRGVTSKREIEEDDDDDSTDSGIENSPENFNVSNNDGISFAEIKSRHSPVKTNPIAPDPNKAEINIESNGHSEKLISETTIAEIKIESTVLDVQIEQPISETIAEPTITEDKLLEAQGRSTESEGKGKISSRISALGAGVNIDALKVGAKHPTLGQKRADDENLEIKKNGSTMDADTVDGSFSHASRPSGAKKRPPTQSKPFSADQHKDP